MKGEQFIFVKKVMVMEEDFSVSMISLKMS